FFSALAHWRRATLSRALVGAGVLANGIGDSAIAYFGALGIVLGVELVDATWFAGSLLLGLAALAAMAERPAQDEDERAPGRWQIALPYVPLVGAVGMALGWLLSGRRLDTFSLAISAVLVVAVVS